MTCWFRAAAEPLTRDELCLEIGGFGAPCVFLGRKDGAWHANFRVPPGTPRGWSSVRLRLKDSRYGATLRIAFDLPLAVEKLEVRGLCDGLTFTPGAVGETLSCWVAGLPENVDTANVRLWIGEQKLTVMWVGEEDASGARQVNASAPAGCKAGEFRVECGGVSASFPVRSL